MSAIRTTCAYCGVGCGISATVTGARSAAISGDVDHPANAGKLCSKGTHLGETVGLEGRLLHPMIGNNQASWDDALDLTAARMRAAIDQYGPDSVAFYVSGQLLTEDYYIANKLMKGFIGSGNIDTNSRLCMASAVASHNRAFGEDVVPCSYDDLDEADLILLVGSNTAWCHPVIWQRIEAARARRGTRLVVIDPRRTETAELADLHIPIDLDGDISLFNALLAAMRDRGLVDTGYLARNCVVPDGYIDGLSARYLHANDSLVDQLVTLVADHPRMVTLFSQGANQSRCGTDKGNSIINLHLAMGRINQPGMGPFSITGQPNAMGGREVGGLATTLACHLGFSTAEIQSVAEFWGAPNICKGPGLKAVDLFRAVDRGDIKFLWVMATNPAVSMPDAGFVRSALAKCETLVVSDIMAETDTGRLATIRLPALGWGEKDGTVTNSDRHISRQRALFEAPGEARADWAILCDFAARMGWGEAFDFSSQASVFREYAAMTALASAHGKALDLSHLAAITDPHYDALEPFQWGGAHPLARRFSHPDGKARVIAVAAPKAVISDPAFPMRLNTGRYRDQWHTMTRTGLSPTLSQHRREALVEIHPDDALRPGITDGGLARITTAAGAAVFRVSVTNTQQRGGLFVPMHWTDVMAGGAQANRLPLPDHDPISGQPGFKNTPARIEPVQPDWRAFLACRVMPNLPPLLYWSKSRLSDGWLIELAGVGDCGVETLLPAGHRLEVADSTRGMKRIVITDANGSLLSALFVTRSGALPARDWIASMLSDSTSASGIELLAGRPANPAADDGPVVCICHDVGERTIVAAATKGADSVAAIGSATRAGTNCGSCRPAIARLLAMIPAPQLEAAE